MVSSGAAPSLTANFAGREFRFTRSLTLEGRSLVARYSATNRATEPLPYLWALHGLLRVEPGERIELPGIDEVAATYLTVGGTMVQHPTVPWSTPGPLPFAPDRVQPASANFAGKFCTSGVAGGSARIGRRDRWLELSWDDSIDHLGIWITYGGWPGPGGHHEVALEPTNAPVDGLGEAIAAGATPLAPGERRDWRVTLSLVS